MSEEKSTQEEKKEAEQSAVKLSSLLAKKGEERLGDAADAARRAISGSCNQELISAQIQNNQELYTTLSRSLLELHNDVRKFREKGEAVDKMIFSLQQGVNKISADIHQRISNVEIQLSSLTELLGSSAEQAEKEQEAVPNGDVVNE